MPKSKFYTVCPKCGKTYHYSHDICPHCGLIGYWLDMAGYYKKKARECEDTARRLQEEKDREEAQAKQEATQC